MIYSHKHRFCHVHVPKNAGSSIEACMESFCEMPQEALSFHVGANAARWVIREWDDIITFAVVRNPWDRAVSQYHYVLQAQDIPGHEKDASFDWVSGMSGFEEYCLKVLAAENRNFFSRPQHSWITDEEGHVLVDHVLRFENLEDDFAEVCDVIGIEAELPHLCRTERPAYQEAHTEITKAIVAKVFAEDIGRFGYEF